MRSRTRVTRVMDLMSSRHGARRGVVSGRPVAALLTSCHLFAILYVYPVVASADCSANGNLCPDEGQAYIESYNRADALRVDADTQAQRVGAATRYKVCGPVTGTMNDYPYKGQSRVGWSIEAMTNACAPYFSQWNYWETSCSARPPESPESPPPAGQEQCSRGCRFKSQGLSMHPTGVACVPEVHQPDKNNDSCDAPVTNGSP